MIAINDILILGLNTKRALNTATITTTRVDTKHAQIAFEAPQNVEKKNNNREKIQKKPPLPKGGTHAQLTVFICLWGEGKGKPKRNVILISQKAVNTQADTGNGPRRNVRLAPRDETKLAASRLFSGIGLAFNQSRPAKQINNQSQSHQLCGETTSASSTVHCPLSPVRLSYHSVDSTFFSIFIYSFPPSPLSLSLLGRHFETTHNSIDVNHFNWRHLSVAC